VAQVFNLLDQVPAQVEPLQLLQGLKVGDLGYALVVHVQLLQFIFQS